MDQDGHAGYELVIRNVGQGPAKEVKFEFTGDPSYFRNSFVRNAPPQLNELPAIKDGLDYMEAGYTLRFTLGTVTTEEFQRAAQKPWTITVRYKNLVGKSVESTYVLDFSQFQGTIFRRNWAKEGSNSLDSISRELTRWGTGFHKIHVISHQEKSGELHYLQPTEDELASQSEHSPAAAESVENGSGAQSDYPSEPEC